MKKMKKIAARITAAGSMLYALPALAQDTNSQTGGQTGGLQTGGQGARSLGDLVNTSLRYGTLTGLGTRDVRAVIMLIINVILGFLSVVAIVIILAGGFKWMTAGGNEEKVDEAKKLIVAGVVGLAIIFMSYAIAAFVVRSLVNVTT